MYFTKCFASSEDQYTLVTTRDDHCKHKYYLILAVKYFSYLFCGFNRL